MPNKHKLTLLSFYYNTNLLVFWLIFFSLISTAFLIFLSVVLLAAALSCWWGLWSLCAAQRSQGPVLWTELSRTLQPLLCNNGSLSRTNQTTVVAMLTFAQCFNAASSLEFSLYSFRRKRIRITLFGAMIFMFFDMAYFHCSSKWPVLVGLKDTCNSSLFVSRTRFGVFSTKNNVR